MGACCSTNEPAPQLREGEAPTAAPAQSWGNSLMSAATTLQKNAPMLMAAVQSLNVGPPMDAATKAAVDEKVAELDDGADIPVSTCTGNKKSLFVGINYFGTKSELHGCINDVRNIRGFVVEKFHFAEDADHMLVLTDDSKDPTKVPTRANMISAMKWLVAGAQSGDSLFFHYSGHGGTQQDAGSDEVDGNDENLVPSDYQTAGCIVDDELHSILVASLPVGVRLTAIMDCCHSGSVFDLPYTYGMTATNAVYEKDNRKAAIAAAMVAGMSLLKGDTGTAFTKGKEAYTLFTAAPAAPNAAPAAAAPAGATYSTHASAVKVRTSLADVIQFSGCRDEQTSADATLGGQACGAMSWALIQAFQQKGMEQTYVELLANVRTNLQGKFQQVPQMSAGHRMRMNVKFLM